jgi:hypothetical protein
MPSALHEVKNQQIRYKKEKGNNTSSRLKIPTRKKGRKERYKKNHIYDNVLFSLSSR